MPLTKAEHGKKYREDHRKRGLCFYCSRPAKILKDGTQRIRCAPCAKKMGKRSAAMRKQYHTDGKCYCGRDPAPQRSLCLKCLQKHAARTKRKQHARKQAGLCVTLGCKRKLSTKTLCKKCAQRLSDRQTKRAAERKRQGLCRQCARPLTRGRTTVCTTCQPAAETLQEARERKARQKAEEEEARNREVAERLAVLETNRHRLSVRTYEILLWHWATNAETLDAIGQRQHPPLSRERIRQIEARGLAVLDELEEPEAVPIAGWSPLFIEGFRQVQSEYRQHEEIAHYQNPWA